MAVFNPIEFDGRVKRSAATLNKDYQVILFCPVSMKSTKLDLPGEIAIKRGWLSWKEYPTSVSLVIFWVQFIYIALAERPKIVYSHDFYLPFPGLLAAKLVGALSIYDAHELIIPNPPDPMSLRDRIYYWTEKVSVRHHDLVIAANPERAKLMKDHYELITLPTAIRNVSKLTLGSIDRTLLLKNYSDLRRENDEKFIIYMGYVALQRGLSAVIGALDDLPENISLIVVGDGPDRLMLQERHSAQSSGKKRVRLLGAIPQLLIQDVLSLCDVGVLVYSMVGLNNYYCSPNKIFEYTQAGLPVVTTAQPPLVTMLNEYNIGRLAGTKEKTAQPMDFAVAIREVFEVRADLIKNIPTFLAKNTLDSEQERLQKMTRSIFMEKKVAR